MFITDNNNENSTLIKRCNGTLQRNCGVWLQCLEDYKFGLDAIPANSSFNITIYQPHSLNSLCDANTENPHPFALNLEMEINCSDQVLLFFFLVLSI